MATIFVAYGVAEHRTAVLSFAAERAQPCGHDLLVFHIQEDPVESPDEIRSDVDEVLERVAPDVAYEVVFDAVEEYSDMANVSKQKRFTDALTDFGGDLEYVVMGDVPRGSIDEFTHGSMTKAALKLESVPVLLVPV